MSLQGSVISSLGNNGELSCAGEVCQKLARGAGRLAQTCSNDTPRTNESLCHCADNPRHCLGFLDVARLVNDARVLPRQGNNAHLGICETSPVAGKLVWLARRIQRKPRQRLTHERREELHRPRVERHAATKRLGGLRNGTLHGDGPRKRLDHVRAVSPHLPAFLGPCNRRGDSHTKREGRICRELLLGNQLVGKARDQKRCRAVGVQRLLQARTDLCARQALLGSCRNVKHP